MDPTVYAVSVWGVVDCYKNISPFLPQLQFLDRSSALQRMPEPLKAGAMNDAVLEQPSSLRLAGCGNEHALFRALDRPRLRGYVLRLRHKQNAAISMASPSPLPALVASLGEALVQHPIALVRIEDALAAELADVARQGRDPPLALAHSTILAMEAALLTKDGSGDSSDGLSVASAWLERDHLRLDGDGFGLCIELKPKAGLLAAGEPLASIAPGRCRF